MMAVATLTAVGTAEGAAPGQSASPVDSPAERVLGIGGLFFRSREPQRLAQWYQLHLGVDSVPTDYGHQVWQQAAGPTAFSPFAGLSAVAAHERIARHLPLDRDHQPHTVPAGKEEAA